MKYAFTFSEINYGRIEVEADYEPDNGEIIEKIMEGMADYKDTDFTDIELVEVDGEVQSRADEFKEPWSQYLQYLRNWADSHADPGFSGTTPACYDEWLNNEYQQENEADDSYDCCLHDTPRAFDWCEENCERYYSCDTVAWAMDEVNEDRDVDESDSHGSYRVTITETLQKEVTVEATNQCEAEEMVQNEWDNQDHILDADHFKGVRFEAVPVVA